MNISDKKINLYLTLKINLITNISKKETMSKNNEEKIGKILEYIFSVKPDEFQLVPDKNGFYNFREVLKAISEKKELSWITKGKILSFLKLDKNQSIELIEPNLIRALNRTLPEFPKKTENLPGELYTCIRQKAWPHVIEKGLGCNNDDKKIILFSNKESAIIKGKRIDQNPVLLFVSTKIALSKGIEFEKFTDNIFLTSYLEPQMFKGPSLEKTALKIKTKKAVDEKKFNPGGTFQISIEDIFPESKNLSNNLSWQKNKKKLRRQKNKLWPDQS